MAISLSFFHRGFGFRLPLVKVAKVLAVLVPLSWIFYFSLYPAHAEGLPIFEAAENPTSTTSFGGATFYNDQAAAIIWQPSVSACLSSVTVKIARTNNPTDYLRLEFRSYSGSGDPDVGGASAVDILGSTVSAYPSFEYLDFAFPTCIPVVEGEEYSVVLKRTGSWDSTNYYTMYYELNYTGTDILEKWVSTGGSWATSTTRGWAMIGYGYTTDTSLPSSIDGAFGDTALSTGDLIDNYPSHDTQYGACDFWGSAAGDGLECVFSWVKYALFPVDNSLTGALFAPVETLAGRWPFAYIAAPINAFFTGFENGACPFPAGGFAGGEYDGFQTDNLDFCDLLDTADFDGLIEDYPWQINAIVMVIYFWLGFYLFKIARDFLTSG